ncbi:unnamed protein product [Candidula unifasciata]|uniref:Myotrophin n=1 Tax=Candidula unifasciata TaxID=100452 RepID=A0A8S3Z582_9EUPU|nr:unnamed protein product [Candidula unifasciata]
MILNISRPKFIKPDTGHAEVVKCLISHGASLTKVNEDHQTPVQVAELYKAQDVLDVLTKSAV